jgi:hypothetical protein
MQAQQLIRIRIAVDVEFPDLNNLSTVASRMSGLLYLLGRRQDTLELAKERLRTQLLVEVFDFTRDLLGLKLFHSLNENLYAQGSAKASGAVQNPYQRVSWFVGLKHF